MATREKILVLAMIVAVGYGAYAMFWPDERETASTVQDRQMLLDQVKAATDAADQGRLSPRQRHVMQEALLPWPGNPFHRHSPDIAATERNETEAAVPDPLPEFVYQGYLETDEVRLAMINGRPYAEGERMREPGFEVLTLNPKSVVIVFRAASGEVAWRKEYTLEDGFL
ncbi:hypothetical protein [Desulfonatronum thiodismutans]|uniref:hypothetical protein n=1 Tax=Desulfonatronum thiodismutans TaxID=159290 RepID=UPI0004ABDA0C|nr:hypothetical protein [Desulfonatronum thiodismutans]